MNPLLNPVGPRSASIYWRRRVAVLVALAVLLLVIFLAVRVVAGGGEAGPSASAEPRPASTPAASQGRTPSGEAAASQPERDGLKSSEQVNGQEGETASATSSRTTSPGEAVPCDARAVRVSATADSKSYEPGQRPKLGVMIRNVGDGPCSLDAGSKAVELTVVSGGDRVWSSDDCQRDAASDPQTLEPGAELRSSVTWDARRSTSGCPADLPAAASGAYQLTGTVGDLTSEPVTFRIG